MLLRLVDKIKEAEDVTSFIFKPEMAFPWKAGQFLHYTLPHRNFDERGLERYFTIASAPHEQVIYITTRFAKEKGSSFKKALRSLKLNDTTEAVGPDGNFTVDDPNQEMVFIAGGIGITPFRAILLDLEHKKIFPKITLLYSNKTPDFPYIKLLGKLMRLNRNLRIHYFIGPKRINEDSIRKIVENLKKPIFYVSGPGGMVKNLSNQLKEIGVPKEHIKQDLFPGYD